MSLVSARPPGLVDVLDRILDKGLVIAGDIKVSLANVELLTLQIRLLVCSIDKAEQIGLNWWRYDTNLTTRAERAEAENVELRERLADLEQQVMKHGLKLTQALGPVSVDVGMTYTAFLQEAAIDHYWSPSIGLVGGFGTIGIRVAYQGDFADHYTSHGWSVMVYFNY